MVMVRVRVRVRVRVVEEVFIQARF